MKPMSRRPASAGFTLVELMISLALGLLIILALVTMLINVNRNNTDMGNANRLVENGRFASQLLTTDVIHAGYWGGYVPNYDSLQYTGVPELASVGGGTVPTAVPDPCAAFPTAWTDEYKANLVGIPVQASNVTDTGTKPFCDALLTDAKQNSDVLVVRHVETCVAGSGTNECAAVAANTLYFQASTCDSDASGFVLGTTGFDLKKRSGNTACGATADVRKFASTIYYVKDANPPVLMRSQMGASGIETKHLDAQALVEGVENFRVEFGIDSVSDSGGAVTATAAVTWANDKVLNSPTNRGDGIPEGAYVRCTQASPCTAYQLMNAVAVKLYVLVRAEKETLGWQDTKTYALGSTTLGPFNDGYKRHVFSQTIRLVNVSGRRETP